jgi:deoxyribodipyrimidine photolyase-related protein
MGNYKKGNWQMTWDALFWRFLSVHRGFFAKNKRLGMLLKTWDGMAAEKQKDVLQTAEVFLSSLHS